MCFDVLCMGVGVSFGFGFGLFIVKCVVDELGFFVYFKFVVGWGFVFFIEGFVFVLFELLELIVWL